MGDEKMRGVTAGPPTVKFTARVGDENPPAVKFVGRFGSTICCGAVYHGELVKLVIMITLRLFEFNIFLCVRASISLD